MTPGLALFYAGTVRTKNVLAMMQQNIIALGVISITWVVIGYSLVAELDDLALAAPPGRGTGGRG